MPKDDKSSKPSTQSGGVQGEGDYEAARAYRRETESFVAKHRKDIPQMAEDAEKALDGAEASGLKKAEDIGKSKARHQNRRNLAGNRHSEINSSVGRRQVSPTFGKCRSLHFTNGGHEHDCNDFRLRR